VSGWCDRGWQRFEAEPDVTRWVEVALPAARAAVADPANAQWMVCEGTWFVGVDALPNDLAGQVGPSGPLAGSAVEALTAWLGGWPALHPAQLSVTYPGYPRPRDQESDAAFRYRVKRDAAHVDGLLAEGPDRRRYLREPHAFILGLPLNDAPAEAAPLVVWEGSHRIIHQRFAEVFARTPEEDWADTDLTEVYQAARREVFETCPRVVLPGKPGEAMVLHPHVLHGVAPWPSGAEAGPDGRMIAYFRPQVRTIRQWLDLAEISV